jgi:type I restriction enzyme S subunit
LGSVVDNRGRTVPTATSGIRLIATNCIKEDGLYPHYENVRYISSDTYRTWFRGHPRPGDVIFVNKGTPGQTCLVPESVDFCIAQDMVALRSNPEVTDNNYLFAVLRSPLVKAQIRNHTVGTMIPHFKKGDFDKVWLPCPPKLEAARVGRLHRLIGNKIELNRKMNQTLEATAQAIFKSWFIDFDGVPAEDLVESELGLIPKGWEVQTLKNQLAVLETGNRPKGGVAKFKSGVPSVGAESITGIGKFDFKKTKYIPEEFFASMKKGVVENRDVLVYKDGGKPGDFRPHVSLFGEGFPFERYAINSHVYRLRTTGYLSQEYLYFWLSSEPMMAEMRRLGTGAAIPGIPRRNLMAMPLLVPPADLHDRFNKFTPTVGKILGNASESRTLTALRDTLLPKLISGEVRVPEAEAQVEALG